MGVEAKGSPRRSRSPPKADPGRRSEVTIDYPQARSGTFQSIFDRSTDDYDNSRGGYLRDDFFRDDSPVLSSAVSSVSSSSDDERSRGVPASDGHQEARNLEYNRLFPKEIRAAANDSFYARHSRRSGHPSDEESRVYVPKGKKFVSGRNSFCSHLTERQAQIIEERPDSSVPGPVVTASSSPQSAYNRPTTDHLGTGYIQSHEATYETENADRVELWPTWIAGTALGSSAGLRDSSQHASRTEPMRPESEKKSVSKGSSSTHLQSRAAEASKLGITSSSRPSWSKNDQPHLNTLHSRKVDPLGRLRGGRKYACPTHKLRFSQPSGKLYVRAEDCAWLLGYHSAEELIKSHPWLSVSFKVGKRPGTRSKLRDDRFFLALDAFKAFGHRLVRRGRPVFDDYFALGAIMSGLEDNTLWGAAQGLLPEKRVSDLLSLGQPDFNKLDSTSNTPLSYMTEKLRESISPMGTVGQDAVSETLWRAVLQSESRPHAEDSLREIIDDWLGAVSSKLSTRHLHTLISALDFCAHIGLFETDEEVPESPANHWSLERGQSRPYALVSQWEIPGLLGKQRSADTSRSTQEALASHLTFSGDLDKFSCCSCSDYLSRRWGMIGRSALSLICKIAEHLLHEDAEAVTGIITQRGHLISQRVKVFYAASRNHFALYIDANQGHTSEIVEPLFEAIAWACSALRSVPQEDVTGAFLRSSRSRKDLLSTETEHENEQEDEHEHREKTSKLDMSRGFVLVKLSPLVRSSLDPSSRCWANLFKSFPVVNEQIERPWGRGLQISFSLMVELSAVENLCMIEGRIALLGHYTALIPTEEMEGGDCLQWHLEVASPSEGVLLPSQLVQRLSMKTWINIDPQEMYKKTCFLGWCSHAEILLGTKSFIESQKEWKSPNNLDFAKSHLERDTVEAGFQISLGIPGIEPILKGSKGWRHRDDTVARSPVDDYKMSLQFARRKTCLLVDAKSKQAWLIPVLSVVFHLCHLFYVMNSMGTNPTPIPYAQPSSDGDLAVLEAIGECAELDVLGSRFSAIFHQQYRNLMDHPRLATTSFLYANDLLHSLENKRTYPRKIPLASGGFSWPDLLPFGTAADVVAVATDVGQVLQPVLDGGNGVCSCVDSGCHKLPVGCCYLAAHVPSLKYICDLDEVVSAQRCKFSLSQISWVIRADPWRLRPCGGSTIWKNRLATCSVLQQTGADVNSRWSTWIKEKRNGHARQMVPIVRRIPSEGIVVFGRQT